MHEVMIRFQFNKGEYGYTPHRRWDEAVGDWIGPENPRRCRVRTLYWGSGKHVTDVSYFASVWGEGRAYAIKWEADSGRPYDNIIYATKALCQAAIDANAGGE